MSEYWERRWDASYGNPYDNIYDFVTGGNNEIYDSNAGLAEATGTDPLSMPIPIDQRLGLETQSAENEYNKWVAETTEIYRINEQAKDIGDLSLRNTYLVNMQNYINSDKTDRQAYVQAKTALALDKLGGGFTSSADFVQFKNSNGSDSNAFANLIRAIENQAGLSRDEAMSVINNLAFVSQPLGSLAVQPISQNPNQSQDYANITNDGNNLSLSGQVYVEAGGNNFQANYLKASLNQQLNQRTTNDPIVNSGTETQSGSVNSASNDHSDSFIMSGLPKTGEYTLTREQVQLFIQDVNRFLDEDPHREKVINNILEELKKQTGVDFPTPGGIREMLRIFAESGVLDISAGNQRQAGIGYSENGVMRIGMDIFFGNQAWDGRNTSFEKSISTFLGEIFHAWGHRHNDLFGVPEKFINNITELTGRLNVDNFTPNDYAKLSLWGDDVIHNVMTSLGLTYSSTERANLLSLDTSAEMRAIQLSHSNIWHTTFAYFLFSDGRGGFPTTLIPANFDKTYAPSPYQPSLPNYIQPLYNLPYPSFEFRQKRNSLILNAPVQYQDRITQAIDELIQFIIESRRMDPNPYNTADPPSSNLDFRNDLGSSEIYE